MITATFRKTGVFQNLMAITNINLNKRYHFTIKKKIVVHIYSAQVKKLKIPQSIE